MFLQNPLSVSVFLLCQHRRQLKACRAHSSHSPQPTEIIQHADVTKLNVFLKGNCVPRLGFYVTLQPKKKSILWGHTDMKQQL